MSVVRVLAVTGCLTVGLLSACTSGSDVVDDLKPSRRSGGISGEAAPGVWELDPAQPAPRTATSVTALVTRLGCNGGVTGEVVRPHVEMTASQIVVTFQVTPRDPEAATCPSNQPVLYLVELGEPVGGRRLVDGRCLPGGEAEATSLCAPSRWNGQQGPAGRGLSRR